jgi:hypothetical protein
VKRYNFIDLRILIFDKSRFRERERFLKKKKKKEEVMSLDLARLHPSIETISN